jgi:predicted nuclease of predicted toxin-antitoxin system
MPDFLIDANLPAKISVWQNKRFIHINTIDPYWDDEAIWQYAKTNNLTIISKDKDFLIQQLLKGTPPKVVHIKFGNMKLNDFISVIETCWDEVELLLGNHTLINLYSDKIEAIK